MTIIETPMRGLALLLPISCVALIATGQGGGTSESAPESITVKGCVYPGVECLSFRNGKDAYSIAPSDRLQVGHAYRITGSIGSIGFCQEGKPILSPEKIVEIKLRCEGNAKASGKK
jgi:hypothetical protein